MVSASPTQSGIVLWDASKNIASNSFLTGYTTTVTAAGNTVLTVSSTQQQYFTGATTQTVTLPVTSTLALGQSYTIVNNSSGVVTVNSSGGNAIQAMAANTTMIVTVILTSGTTAASWNATYITDTGNVLPGGINQLAWYASTGSVVSGLASANSAVLVTSSTGVPSLSSTMTNGQLIIGSTGATPVAANLTAGSGISITNGAGTISISSSGNGAWVDQTTASVTMAVNTGYTSDAGATLVTFTLPTTSAIGDYVEVVYKGSGGWTIVYGAGKSIQFGTVTTTTTTGSLSSLDIGSCVRLRCSTANLLWTVVSVVGNLTTV